MWKPSALGVCSLVCLLASLLAHSRLTTVSAQARSTSDPATAPLTDSDPYSKVHGPLRELLPFPADGDLARPSTLQPPIFDVTLGSLVGVTIRTQTVNDTLDALFGLGRLVGNMRGNAIETFLSIPDIILLALRPEIIRVEAIVPAKPLVTSQGQSVHNASNWIAGGIRGQGVKVGVIDVGFQGIQRLIGSEIQAQITARCYTALGVFVPLLATCDGGHPHGTAVVESLVDIAPDVQLFVSQPISRMDFLNTVDWMLSQGVSVINYSATWGWDGPGDGTSPYPDSPLRAVDTAVARGATFVASAGNAGLATWLGPWRDTDVDNVHEFSTTQASEFNSMALTGGQRVELQMRWDASWTAAASDLDLALVDASGNLVARSIVRQTGRVGDTPSEYLSTLAPFAGTFFVKVTRVSGPAPAWVQVQGFNFVPLQFATLGSIGSPAESANLGLLAAGAAAWNTTSTIQPYSSKGPTPDGRVKPDIVGADQGLTVTYGNFGGTSQAAPHVAGLAALVKSAFPSFTPQQVADYLRSSASPRGTGRPNHIWGWGFAALPNLCSSTVTPPSVSVAQAGGQISFTVSTTGSCAWSASAQAPWLTVVSGGSGTGAGTVRANVASNGGAPRTGTLVIANTSVSVIQDGPGTATTNPRNLAVSISGNLATLTWQLPESGTPTGYVFEIGTQPGSSDLAVFDLGTVLYFSFEATPGAYYARVLAKYGATRSSPSNEVTFRIGPAPPGPGPGPPGPSVPSAPQSFGAVVSGRDVSLSWSVPASGAAGLTSFVLEAGTGPGLSNLAVLNVAGLSLFAPNIALGTYYLRVRAVNGSGVGPPSPDVVVIVPSGAPAHPTALTHTVVGATVTLQWQPPSYGGAPSGYVIVAGSAPGLSNLAIVPIGLATSFTAAGVPPGVYYVRVVAINASGASAPSNEVVIVVPG